MHVVDAARWLLPPRSPSDAVHRSLVPLLAVTRGPLSGFRSALTQQVATTMGSKPGLPRIQYAEPAGDPGLFGPDSVTWRVFSDFPSMFIGGVSSLFLQALHPSVMAGVADHSRYKDDPQARLARTGSFVAGTAYGSTRVAEEAIAMVRALHDRVEGVRPDGVPYRANDPANLAWVHVTEVGQFLRGYQRYSGTPLRPDDVDRYYGETAQIARRLGAHDVPTSAGQVRDFYRRRRADLAVHDQARETIAWLLDPGGPPGPEKTAYTVMVKAAVGLLPRWAQRLAGLRFDPVRHWAFEQPAATALADGLRWATGPSPVLAEATDRVARGAKAQTG